MKQRKLQILPVPRTWRGWPQAQPLTWVRLRHHQGNEASDCQQQSTQTWLLSCHNHNETGTRAVPNTTGTLLRSSVPNCKAEDGSMIQWHFKSFYTKWCTKLLLCTVVFWRTDVQTDGQTITCMTTKWVYQIFVGMGLCSRSPCVGAPL